MKHIMFVLITCLLLPSVIGLIAEMPSADAIMPYEPPMNELLTTTNQYYSVTFDGEGDAYVIAKLQLYNADKEDLSTLALEIPGASAQVHGVFQYVSAQTVRQCVEYQQTCQEYGQGQTCTRYDYNGNCVNYEQPCLKYSQTCSRYGSSYSQASSYERINVDPQRLADSVVVPILLDTAISQQGSSDIYVVYKSTDYADAGAVTHFDFETIKTSLMTKTVRVGVNVQEGLILDGVSSSVNYKVDYQPAQLLSAASGSNVESISPYLGRVGYYGQYTKTSSYLDPHESFTVEGKYAESWFALNWGKLLLWIIAGVVIIGLIVVGIKKLIKYSNEHVSESDKKKAKNEKHKFAIPFFTGLITDICVILLGVFAWLLIVIFDNFLRYSAQDIFNILVILFTILLSLAIMIGVPIFTGSRYGVSTGFFTLLSMMGWGFLLSIVSFAAIAILTAAF